MTLDILPLVRVIAKERRLEETMFQTSFALEEAKHVELFRRWVSAVDLDLMPFVHGAGAAYGGRAPNLFGGELERIVKRLDVDRSPEAHVDASLTYNHFVEGVVALSAYRMAGRFFGMVQGLHALPLSRLALS